MKTIYNIIFAVLLTGMASCQEKRNVKVTVTEEDGTPIEGATTMVTFLGYNGEQTERVKGLTDVKGVFLAEGRPKLRINVRLEKKGYYNTSSGRLSRKKDHSITYALRRIRNPIPLYAKRAVLDVPVLGQPCGFDFKVGDWVHPHGKGKKTMCLFQMETSVISANEHTQKVTITFPNEGDGILAVDPKYDRHESQFQWLYKAPQHIYLKKRAFTRKRKPQQALLFDAAQFSYAMRVNTDSDQSGNLISANYVRISKGFSFYGILSKSPGIKLTYYYNPTPNDRNMEFDPKCNLFGNLDSTERVNAP